MNAIAADAEGTSALRKISVDTSVTVGRLRPFNGVHGAPAAEFRKPGAPNEEGTANLDISAAYRAADIDLIRTHDAFGPGDIDAHFGIGPNGAVAIPPDRDELTIFPDMTADANDPKSYNFAPTDRLIASIKSVGAEPLFRIGRSIGAAADPPRDLEKYAQVAKHIVLHYNKGWADGYRYAIRYWEIWNEPDFRFFWTGSPELYYAFYDQTVRAIKAADDTTMVGGPTIAMPLDAGGYREGFLDYVRVKHLPLDFFSWHFYTLDSNDPYSFATIGKELRAILDARGFTSTKSVLDEWNVDLFDRDLSKAARAAFAASALIYMVAAPIDVQAYYRADTAFRNPDGIPDPVGHALTAFGSMKRSPILVQSEGGDDAGLAVLAGRSDDGRIVQILISNYQVPAKYLGPRAHGDRMHLPNVMDIQLPARRSLVYKINSGYRLTIKAPSFVRYSVKRYRITDSMNFVLVDQTFQSGPGIRLDAMLPPPGIDFIVLSATAPPSTSAKK